MKTRDKALSEIKGKLNLIESELNTVYLTAYPELENVMTSSNVQDVTDLKEISRQLNQISIISNFIIYELSTIALDELV